MAIEIFIDPYHRLGWNTDIKDRDVFLLNAHAKGHGTFHNMKPLAEKNLAKPGETVVGSKGVDCIAIIANHSHPRGPTGGMLNGQWLVVRANTNWRNLTTEEGKRRISSAAMQHGYGWATTWEKATQVARNMQGEGESLDVYHLKFKDEQNV